LSITANFSKTKLKSFSTSKSLRFPKTKTSLSSGKAPKTYCSCIL